MMKRLGAIALGVILVAGWAISSAKTGTEICLTFNAETRQFIPNTGPSLQSGGVIKVCIIKPNTFREKYTISLDGKDYHNIALPDALKGLIARSTPGVVTVEEGVTGFTPNAGSLNVKMTLPPPFDILYDDYKDRFKDLIDELLKNNLKEVHPDIGREMVENIASAPTNQDAVCGVIRVALNLLPLAESQKQTLQNYCNGQPIPLQSVSAFDKVFTKQADDILKGLNLAYAAFQKATLIWQLAYDRWSLFNQMGTPPVGNDSSLGQFMKSLGAERLKAIEASYAARTAEEKSPRTEDILQKLNKFMSDISTDINKKVEQQIEDQKNLPASRQNTKDQIRTNITQSVYGLILGIIEDTNNRVKSSGISLDAAYKVKLDSLNAARDQLRRASDLFRYCLDPNKVPTCITKTYAVPVSADVVRASIRVEEMGNPFTALEQADTKPTAQQITSDNPASSQIYQQSMPVYGRTVVDYSSGLVVTTLRNQDWFIGSDMKVQTGPGDTANLAVAGFAHLYTTSPNLVIPAFTLGIAAGDNVRYLAGATAVINLNIARAMFTVGAAFGKETVLNNQLEVGATTTASTVPTVTVQRMGVFFGLSFSINL